MLDAANVSDDYYFEDFGIGSEGTSIIFLEPHARGARRHRALAFVGRAQDFQTSTAASPPEDQPYPDPAAASLRWPLERPAPGVAASFAAEAVNFDRDAGVTGGRVDVEPTIGWRIGRRGCYTAPSAALARHRLFARRHRARRRRVAVALPPIATSTRASCSSATRVARDQAADARAAAAYLYSHIATRTTCRCSTPGCRT